jgi:hypothetical protein
VHTLINGWINPEFFTPNGERLTIKNIYGKS